MNKAKFKKLSRYKNLLLLAFLFGLNTFAWFVYVSNVGTDLRASVVSWDIVAIDNGTIVKTLDIDITDMKPGMNDFSKTVSIGNKSSLDATFDYNIRRIKLFGKTYSFSDDETSQNKIKNMLMQEMPYKMTFTKDSDTILKKNSTNFTVKVTWPFEATSDYTKLNELYDFNANYTYYTKNGNTYQIEPVTASDFESKRDNLYLTSDDADTYWGERSADYYNNNSSSIPVEIQIDLIAKQKKESQ